MGKTTRFHPVSLHVIRGAAEYCGFRFEKIHQLNCFPEHNSARYNVTIIEYPKGWDKLTMSMMQETLQDCFMDDIRVHWLRKNRSEQWMCHLAINMEPDSSRKSSGGGGGGIGGRDMPLVNALREVVKRDNFVVLDTETTGLRPPCEIIEIAIVDSHGFGLMEQLIEPKNRITTFTTDLTGINNSMVFGKPSWPHVRKDMLDLIDGRDILVYNAQFDHSMMHYSDDMWDLIRHTYQNDSMRWLCVMEAYAEFFGDWNEYHQSWRWQKLSEANKQQGFRVDGAHRALDDVMMTMNLIDRMCGKL